MLDNIFVGRPAGKYDHLLDFSTDVTGELFFVPSSDLLRTFLKRWLTHSFSGEGHRSIDLSSYLAHRGDEAKLWAWA